MSRRFMSRLPASHYLKIYRLRLGMAERGVTNPRPDAIRFMRQFIAALERMLPDDLVEVACDSHYWAFYNGKTRELLADIHFPTPDVHEELS